MISRMPFELQTESFSIPSITQPDCAYRIKDLYDLYAVGQLPPLARLQTIYDDDETLEASTVPKFHDLTEIETAQREISPVLKAVMSKVKKMRDYMKQHEDD